MTERLFFETRAQLRGNTLAGHAAVFNTTVQLRAGLFERILPGAFAAALQSSDVRALVNHDPSQLIGRQSAGTLRLAEDSTGLAFEVDLPDTGAARDLRTLVDRGDISGASFGFIRDKVDRTPVDGGVLETHRQFRTLFDVSPLTFPAYEATDVSLRGLGDPPGSHREQLIRLRAKNRGTR